MRSCLWCLIGFAALAGTATAQPSMPPAPSPTCREAAARFAIGRRYSPRLAEQGRRRAGARALRMIEPGRVYTMEFRSDRLNLEIDRRGRISAARCG